ncbi:MAG: hypothetical protein H7A51_02015 [Akkermansiaceae bacterium]|nr:hypothetical protein [Akkermansiaceae bacterium]
MSHTMTMHGNHKDVSVPTGPDFDSLSAREQELQDKIARLKDFVEHAPERERLAMEERMRTLPPPSEVERILREEAFMGKLTRGELKNEKRNQAKSGFLLFLLVLAILAVGLWIFQALQ